MKQISARAFREVFRTLEEPVTVSTRGEGGYVKIIGTWTPAIPYADTWARDLTNATAARPAGVIYTIVPGTKTVTVPEPSEE